MARVFISYSLKHQVLNVFVAETGSLCIKYINWTWKESFYFIRSCSVRTLHYVAQLFILDLSMAILLNTREIREGRNLAF